MKKWMTWLVGLGLSIATAQSADLPGVNGTVHAIKMYKTSYSCGAGQCCELTQLIVGGQFTLAGSTAVNNLARWNGTSWEAMGSGVNGPVYAIEAVPHYPGDPSPDIYVGGTFTDKGNGFARWNGTTASWSSLSGQLSSTGFGSLYWSSFVSVRTIKLIGSELWVGGRFFSGGAVTSRNLIRFQPATQQWQALGTQTLFAGGQVYNGPGIPSPLVTVTSISADGIVFGAARNEVPGQPWAPVNVADYEGFYSVSGSVFYGQGRSANMRAVSTGGGVIAGHDQFIPQTWAPATWESTVAHYSGVTELNGVWQLLGYNGAALPPAGSSPWTPVGTSPSGWKTLGPVYAMISHNGDTYIGGNFGSLYGANAGQQIAQYTGMNNIFKWNPTANPRWQKLQNLPGSCSVAGAGGVNGQVNAMDVDYNLCTGQFRGIWVGGTFTDAGGSPVSNIALWDGQRWRSIGNQGPLASIQHVEPADLVIAPPGGTTLNGFLIDAYACDSDGTLAAIDFYVDGALVDTAADLEDPIGFWQPPAAGTYQLTVVARDNSGSATTSTPFAYTVDVAPAAPNAPSGLTLTSLSATQVRLNWVDNSFNEQGFFVERSTDGVNYTRIATLGWNVATYTDGSLAANTLYYYRVQAYHRGKVSVFSTVARIMNQPSLCLSKLQDGTEAGTKPRFRIQRPAADFRSVTVAFSVSGTATSGSDFQSMGASAVIPANAAYVEIEATPLEDVVYEGTETVQVTLGAGSGYTIGCATATANLTDNEPLPTVTVHGPYPAIEGGSGGWFYIVPSVTIQRPLVINFTVSGTATAGSDYTSFGTNFSIPGGTAGGNYASLGVSAINDSLSEPTETIVLTLSTSANYNIGGTGAATMKVLDDEATTIYVVATDSAASEAGTNPGQFTIYREGGPSYALGNLLSVPVSYSGTATSGSDYQPLTNWVTIPANQNTASFSVTPTNDAVYEGAETIIATISTPNQGVYVSTGSATINLADDEPLPTVSASAYQQGAEGGANAYIVFYLNVAIERSLTINYSISGSATFGTDYTGPTGSYVLSGPRSAGSYNGPAIVIVNDSVPESTETVIYTIFSNAGYIVSPTAGSATVNITDND